MIDRIETYKALADYCRSTGALVVLAGDSTILYPHGRRGGVISGAVPRESDA